jgi:hypothetical protein
VDLRELLTAAVNSADPVGLLEMEAPPDEYHPEIGRIVARLVNINQKPTARQVNETCESVFVAQFGDDTIMRAGSFVEIAEFMLSRWEEMKPPPPFDA